MSPPVILLIVAAALLVLWIAPSLVSAILMFCGRQRPEVAMGKPYFAPYRAEMSRCIQFLEGLEGRRVSIMAADGIRLSAVWYDRGSRRTIIMAHGYKASAMSNFCISGRAFWERGYNLLLIDQRAHGESGGRVSGFGLRERDDLLRWVDWAEQNTATEALAVYGVSMGCAAMAYASDRIGSERVRAMVLDCGFTSPRDEIVSVARRLPIPWQIMLPVIRLFVRLAFGFDINTSVTASLARTEIPAFFLHGTADGTVSVEDGKRNYAACASEKALELVEGAEHTMAFAAGGTAVRERLFAFLERYMNCENNNTTIERQKRNETL